MGEARNFWLNVADGALFPAGYAFMGPQTVLPLFVASMTDSRLAVGAASALLMAGLALPQLFSARITERTPRYWSWFLLSNGAVRLAVLPWLIVPFLPMPWRLVLLFPAIALFALSWGVAAPVWADFIGRLIPAPRRGAFFGWRNALNGPAGMLATAGASWLLARLAPPLGFAACFAAAFGLTTLSYGCLALTRHAWPTGPAAPRPFWNHLSGRLRDHPRFVRYALARLALAIGTSALAFCVLEGRHRFGLPSSQANLLGIALLALPTLTGVIWGRLADRYGPRAPLWGAIAAGTTGSALTAWAPTLGAYVAGLALLGLVNPLLGMADYNLIYEECPEDRATYFGLFALLQLPVALGAPLAAGYLADRVGMGRVFALAAAAWPLGAMLLSGSLRKGRQAVARRP